MLGFDRLPPVLDEVGRFLIGTDAANVVIDARQPDAALRRALADTGARFVVALDHPSLAAADMLADTGADVRLIARAVATSCALLMHYSPLPGALTIHSDGARFDPAGTVAAIAHHLGIAIDGEAARRIVDELALGGITAALPRPDWAASIPEDARNTVGGALSTYAECFAGRGFGRIVWSRDLFFAGESQRRATEVMELSGGARVLINGPYIHLPAGSWTAQVHLGVSPEAAGQILLIEAYAGAQLAAATLQPGSGGVFVAGINFGFGEPGRDPIEIRVSVTQDDAKGELALGRVVLQLAENLRRSDAIGSWEDIKRALDL